MSELGSDYRVDILFPDDYKDMIAEVYFQDQFICLLSQDEGFHSLDLEIPALDRGLKVKLDELGRVIEYAKRRLWDLRRNQSEVDPRE